MSYIVFARKYRPKNFDEIIGQGHITTTLKNAIASDRVAHAYLFSGPRGVGKTTTARILAKALNCEKGPTFNPCDKCASCRDISSGISMDVIEIDGASNRGIDEVRELRENVKFSPSHGRYKMYIIDEVHMLTQEAFNALLKTLEEPPAHVKFVFATTELRKVISTVASRCQRFDFRRVALNDIVSKLKYIAKKESVEIDEEAMSLIARQADGSLRDAESILDQLNTFCSGKVKKDDIIGALGTVDEKLMESFIQILLKKDTQSALRFIDRLVAEGKDLTVFVSNLRDYYRHLIVAKACTRPETLIDLAPESVKIISAQAEGFTEEELLYLSAIADGAHESMKRNSSSRTVFEMAAIKSAKRASIVPLSDLLDKVRDIEERMKKRPPEIRSAAGPAPQPKDEQVILPVKDRAEVKKKDGPSGSIGLSRIQDIWPTLLKIIRTKKISIASYLLEGNLIAVEGDDVIIAFPENFRLHKETLEERPNKRIIEETLRDILEIPVSVKFVTKNSARGDQPALGRKGTGPDKGMSTSEALKDPLIESALEVFDGRIVRKGGF